MAGPEPLNMSTQSPVERQRKSHKKSRYGCRNCKRRRVKCDEMKPACGNCSRLAIPCPFSPALSSDATLTSQRVSRRRGRPQNDWSMISFLHHVSAPSIPQNLMSTLPLLAASASSELTVQPSPHFRWTVEDLELFHHYQSHTALTLGDTPLWRDRVPRLAFRQQCVLHLIIALSALHLMRIKPSQSSRFEKKAEAHLAVGLRQAMTMLPALNEDNAAPLYIATVLVCSCTFAKVPGSRHLLVISDGDEVAWWELFRGVRIVVETIGIDTIFSGELGPLPPEIPEVPFIVDHIEFGFTAWEEAVRGLSKLVVNAPEEVIATYQEALSILIWCFEETYGTSAKPKSCVEGKFERIMSWLYLLSDNFVLNLKTKQPAPLVMLAYFTVLLQLLERFWYIRGWAVHVLQGIAEILDPTYSSWLQWPMEQVEQNQRRIDAGRGTEHVVKMP